MQKITISEYELTDEPIENPYLKKLPHSTRKKIRILAEELLNMAFLQPHQAVARLKEAMKQYPDVPPVFQLSDDGLFKNRRIGGNRCSYCGEL